MELDLIESIKMLEKYGIKTAKMQEIENEAELKEKTKKINYPIVMKIVSSKISHKTEKGGVITGINTENETRESFQKLKKIKGFEKAIIQEQIEGIELIIGSNTDPQFGKIILFGLGGIFVEVLNDASIRIIPIEKKDAKEMIEEIKGKKILDEFRGKKAINKKELEGIILKVAKMIEKENIEEMDINPLIANEKEIKAVDARITIEKQKKE